MALMYQIPSHLQGLLESQEASLFGAIIKDNASGHILGHVQQSSGLMPLLGDLFGAGASSGFSPLSVVSVLHKYQENQSLAKISEGMVLMQNLQYGALAMSGLGLGVSIAGFAATLAKLRAIEAQIEALSDEIQKVTEDRREDELRTILAEVSAYLQTLETLCDRRDARSVAEQLQLSFSSAARKLEVHFMRLTDLHGKTSLPIEVLEQLWALAAAIRICQDASLQALFAADELEAVVSLGQIEMKNQMALMNSVTPDALSRLISRSQEDPLLAFEARKAALPQARALVDGLKGGVVSFTGQVSIAQSLRAQDISGLSYLRDARATQDTGLICLTSPGRKTLFSWIPFAKG